MPNQSAPHRVVGLDLLRGILILLMSLGHSIAFFHTGFQPSLSALSNLADTVCFTGLLFISGITGYLVYIGSRTPQMGYRVAKRLLVYLIGYYALAFYWLLFNQFSLPRFLQILSFQLLPPYLEFIPTLIIIGLIKIPLQNFLYRLSQSWFLTLTWGISLYLIGSGFASIHSPFHLPIWLALGSSGEYSFPILQYFPVYLFGLWFGNRLVNLPSSQLHRFLFFLLISLSLVFLGGVATTLMMSGAEPLLVSRFPPSVPFLIMGMIFSLLFFLIFDVIPRTRLLLRSILPILGQNAFAIFFGHTLTLFTYRFLGFPRTPSTVLTLSLWLFSLGIALYLAKILPLNFSFGLTIIRFGKDFHFSASELNRLERLFLSLVSNLFNLPKLFSLPLKNRRLYLFSVKNVVAGSLFLLAAVTPLGIAEDLFLNQSIWQSHSGTLSHSWALVGESVDFQLAPPPGLEVDPQSLTLEALLNHQPVGVMNYVDDHWTITLPSSILIPGQHQVNALIKVGQTSLETQSVPLVVSHPLYITWTVDWEGYDVPDTHLSSLEAIARDFGIPVTHMFNPRIYTNPEISSERAEYLTQWLKQRLSLGDDLGLHLHMFPDFFTAAGLTPVTEPVWGGGFSPGYDVPTTAVSTPDLIRLIDYSLSLFDTHGLPKPISYRAGAWFANADTLNALETTGLLVDSSGRTAYSFGTNHLSGFWDLSPQTYPYYPSKVNQNSDQPVPRYAVLEIPNNGADDYAFPASELIHRFELNFEGKPLLKPQQITYLSHPQWLDSKRSAKMRTLFNYLSPHLASSHQGPVVYTTLSTVYQVFK